MNIPKDDLFFDLLRSGLWDKAGTVADYSSVDWKALIRLAREQTVVGLISDGGFRAEALRRPTFDAL